MNGRQAHEPARDFLPQSKTWDEAETLGAALGCASCPSFNHCGGLHVAAEAYDCLSYCSCTDQSKCDIVCPNNAHTFVRRIREVGGFSLRDVERAKSLAIPELPDVVPYIQHPYRRAQTFVWPSAAVPLHKLYDLRTGKLHVQNRDELARRFRIDPSARVVATGVDRDFRVESWWEWFWTDKARLGALRELGVSLITVPNFSLLTNVPRHDNLHAMKRIALCWSAIMRRGIQAALHVNARTARDYERWAAFIKERDEVSMVAFEFGTGCGSGNRIDWHLQHLGALADEVRRPLTLVLRGALGRLPELKAHFSKVVVIDTAAFRKSINRSEGTLGPDNRIHWSQSPTEIGEPLDHLLAHNVRIVEHSILNAPPRRNRSPTAPRTRHPRAANDADRESGQMSLLR